MLEQNTHRMAMTILGVIVLAMIVGALFVAGSNPNDNATDELSFFDQSNSGIVQQNEIRTHKY